MLVAWWKQAGLRDIEQGEFEVSASYKDFDDLWAPFAAGVGQSGSLYVRLDALQQASLREDVWRRMGSPVGAFDLTARVRWIRGLV